MSESQLAALIRPAGYFNVKARRLRSFLRVLVEEFGGDLERLFAGETAAVRERLLAINGIGPETADSMLLYAGGHHRFVIDAYTKRIFQRHGWSGAQRRLRGPAALVRIGAGREAPPAAARLLAGLPCATGHGRQGLLPHAPAALRRVPPETAVAAKSPLVFIAEVAYLSSGFSYMNKTLVVVPTYNERENLPPLAQRLLALPVPVDLLVVDDNSPDGTGKLADELAAKHPAIHVLHRTEKSGLGRAYIAGFKWALERGYEFVFELDGDFSHNPDDIPMFLEAARNADLVLGSRYLNGIRIINWPLSRLMLSKCAAKYVQIITGMPFTDPTGGYKCFTRRALQAINLDEINSNGYSFQIEMTHRLWRQGMRIVEVPIIFTERVQGHSKMSGHIIREALFMVWRLWFQNKMRRRPAVPPAKPPCACRPKAEQPAAAEARRRHCRKAGNLAERLDLRDRGNRCHIVAKRRITWRRWCPCPMPLLAFFALFSDQRLLFCGNDSRTRSPCWSAPPCQTLRSSSAVIAAFWRIAKLCN